MLQQHDQVPDVIDALQQEMARGSSKLFDVVPTLLRTVLDERAWESRADKAGKPFTSFEAFVIHPVWQGLESSVADLVAYCRNAPDVQQQIRAAVAPVAGHGVNQHSGGRDNVTSSDDDERGNAATYTLRRLKRDRPELAQQVINGTLSANAAAIQAGFRKRMVSVPAEDLPTAIRLLAKHYGAEAVIAAALRLHKDTPGFKQRQQELRGEQGA